MHRPRSARFWPLFGLLPLLAACEADSSASSLSASRSTPVPSASAKTDEVAPGEVDEEAFSCRKRVAEALAAPASPGAPAFEAARVEILGRARGEPLLLVREPQTTPEATLDPRLVTSAKSFVKERPGGRIVALRRRHLHDPRALRALLLREGYAYSADPADALGIATQITLPDLFDEPNIVLMRGQTTFTLEKKTIRKETRYVDEKGKVADLLFGDRVGLSEDELKTPLHRDLAALADAEGFDRTRIKHLTEGAIVADLRFGEVWASALLVSSGAKLSLGCFAEEKKTRTEIALFQKRNAAKRRALASIRGAVSKAVDEVIRFDRPEAEPNHFRDGILRPQWMTAYLQGRDGFGFEGKHYAVFDAEGRAWPPEVCVDFVLDTFERAAGTWYAPKGEKPGRILGRLNWDDSGIKNRRGVIGFGDFAEAKPDLFEMKRFQGAERIPYGERSKFFAWLTEHADELRPGDVTSIQGLKRDNFVHQHAIFVERADPVTGFPFGLADQMKRPRRRTWEGIMAEAPKRSLFYRARPTEAVITKIDPGEN